jgi:acyl dehydratase
MISNYSFEEIELNKVFSFKKKFSREDVLNFAELSGDINPLHIDSEYGDKSIFGRNIVHGMLISSLFSKMVGVYCPGENSLYLSQSLEFRKPLFFNEEIEVRAKVIKKISSVKVVEMKMEILRQKEKLVSGIAKIKVLD